MIIYIYSKCSTCRDAVKFLEKHQQKFTVKEITQETPSILELQQMLNCQQGNLKKLFNTSGLLYKEMQLKEKLATLSEQESLSLLHQHGMLVKRPFLLGKDFGLVGFKETEWLQILDRD